MNTENIVMCVVALLLGMLLANMLKNVCGCKVVEGQGCQDRAGRETWQQNVYGSCGDLLGPHGNPDVVSGGGDAAIAACKIYNCGPPDNTGLKFSPPAPDEFHQNTPPGGGHHLQQIASDRGTATTAQPRNRLPRTAEYIGAPGKYGPTTAAIRMADLPSGWEAWYKFKAVEGHRYKILTFGSVGFDPKLWVMRDGHAGVLGETPVEESDDHPAGPTITEATIDFDSYSSPSTSRCHPSLASDMTQCSYYYVKVVGDVKGGGKSTLSITDMGKTEDLVGGGQ